MSLADLPSLNYCQATIGNRNIPKNIFFGQSRPTHTHQTKILSRSQQNGVYNFDPPSRPHDFVFLLGEVEIDALLLQLRFKGYQK